VTLEDTILAAVRQAVAAELAPLRRDLAALRDAQRSELVETAEAARRLRVSVRTVQRMVRDGELPSVRVGRSYRVRLSEVLPPAVE
jgi:excisionase family DNA binding protein